jgi:hypothetical protein
MRDERLEASVTFDERRGQRAQLAQLEAAVAAMLSVPFLDVAEAIDLYLRQGQEAIRTTLARAAKSSCIVSGCLSMALTTIRTSWSLVTPSGGQESSELCRASKDPDHDAGAHAGRREPHHRVSLEEVSDCLGVFVDDLEPRLAQRQHVVGAAAVLFCARGRWTERGQHERQHDQSSHRPQSSSASRRAASHAGFFDLSQSGERPDRRP